MFFRSMLNGLTTIFGWTPASVLAFIAAYGLYAGVINFVDVHWSITLGLLLIGLGGIAGYVGLTAVAWNINLPTKTKLICLGFGVVTLTTVIIIGALSESEVLYVGLYWVDLYLFVSPLLFALGHFIHLAIVFKNERTASNALEN